jgi:hypothetical protein
MFTNPINKKQYCVSQCAKDKFQKHIVPLFTWTVIIIATSVAVFLFGLITQQVQVWFLSGLTSLSLLSVLPVFHILLTGLIAAAFIAVIFIMLTIVGVALYEANNKLNHWCNTKYESKYKKDCVLFEECTE